MPILTVHETCVHAALFFVAKSFNSSMLHSMAQRAVNKIFTKLTKMSVSSEQSTDIPENAYRRIEKIYKIRYAHKEKVDKLGRKRTKRPQEEPMPSLDGVLDFRSIEKNSDSNKAQIVQIKDTKQWFDDHKLHMDLARQQFDKVHGEAAHKLAPNFEENFELYGLKDYPGTTCLSKVSLSELIAYFSEIQAFTLCRTSFQRSNSCIGSSSVSMSIYNHRISPTCLPTMVTFQTFGKLL